MAAAYTGTTFLSPFFGVLAQNITMQLYPWALLDEGASGLERFAAFATSQQSLVNPEPVEPLYLRRPDVSVPNPLKHVLNHAGAERTE